MPTVLDGQANLAALQVPGVYVDVVTPSPNLIGVPTNQMGVVGVGSWGPLNALIYVSKPNDCAIKIGTPIVRSHDIATHIWAASQVGGSTAFVCVRVDDGTSVAATATVQTSCITITAKYTGILGNAITFTVNNGTAANSYSVQIGFPGGATETFNNITGSGNALWIAIAAAINNGNATRGASNYVIATAGAGTTAPTLATPVTLTGGTDGASGVTDSTLVGLDTVPRKGMYALRNSGIDAFTLVDQSTSSQYGAIDAFALSESCIAVLATVSGDTISNAVTTRTTVGLDDYWTWLIMGDWPTFYDSQNGYARLVNPTAFGIGLLGNLSPEQSPINKVLRGIVSTQKNDAKQTYSDAELQVAEMGGIDLIVGPPTTPGGAYYSFITGHNASSNTAGNVVEWTRLTNFIARTLQTSAAGSIVGKLQSIQANDPTRAQAKALVDGLMAQLADPASGSGGYGMIDTWSSICDLSNNPPNLQARGYLFVYLSVRYLNAVRFFVIKLAGGGNVTVTSQSTLPTPAQFQ